MKHNFKYYCKDYENIENYDKALADNFKGWHCHHRLETYNSDGERRLVDITMEELKALDMYYDRPSEELIFMKHSEHSKLHSEGEHNSMYGNKHSEEARNKMSDSWKYHKHFTEETKNKMSEAHKGNTATKGMHWYNNGKINKVCYECPDGFVQGMLKIK